MPDRNCKDALNPSQVFGNDTKTPTMGSHAVSIHAFLTITPLALNMKNVSYDYALNTDNVSFFSFTLKFPMVKIGEVDPESFLRDCYIPERCEKLFHMSLMRYNVLKVTVGRSHAHV